MIDAVEPTHELNELPIVYPQETAFSFDEQIEKIKTAFANRPPLSDFIGDYIVTPLLRLSPSFAKVIGELVAYNLIYPKIPQNLLDEEIRFAQIDRDPSITSSDPIKDQIKKDFKIYEEEIPLTNHGLTATGLVFESKRGNTQLPPRHIVIFCGNLASSQVTKDPFPFARAWLELEKEDPNIAPLRITVVSGRNVQENGKAIIPSFDQTGHIHKAMLDQLIDSHGPIDQIVAFSLGCGIAAKVMDCIDDESIDHYPKKWWLHNGPSSLEKVSKNYFLGRTLLWPAAKLIGWDVNPALSLQNFCGRIKKLEKTEQFTFGVSGLTGESDHQFPLEASLSYSPEVQLLKTAGMVNHLLHITLSQGDFHQKAHHGRSLDSIELKHLVDPISGDFYFKPLREETNSSEQPFILPGEHLAHSILREIFSKEKAVPESAEIVVEAVKEEIFEEPVIEIEEDLTLPNQYLFSTKTHLYLGSLFEE